MRLKDENGIAIPNSSIEFVVFEDNLVQANYRFRETDEYGWTKPEDLSHLPHEVDEKDLLV